MNRKKNQKHVKTLDITEYVNAETGEVFDSNNQLIVVKDTGMASIIRDNGEYGTFGNLGVFLDIISDSDLKKACKMAVDIKTPLNMVYNNNVPHTHETLRQYLGIKSESEYHKMLRRLMKAGVIYKLEGLVNGEVRKTILINPFLFTKRKIFDQKVLEIFSPYLISNTSKSNK